MSFDALAVAVIFAVLGFFVGKRSSEKSATLLAQKAAAYQELFEAFSLADSALLNASIEEGAVDQLPDGFKQLVWDSLNSVGRVFARVKFLLPREVAEVLEGHPFGHLGMDWSERLDELRSAKDTLYELARKDVGLDVN